MPPQLPQERIVIFVSGCPVTGLAVKATNTEAHRAADPTFPVERTRSAVPSANVTIR